MSAMHDEEEELALNAKAIGLAIGGAIIAGLLFVLARRDDKKPVDTRAEGAVDTAVEELKQSGKEAKKKQKALKKAAEKHAREAALHAKHFAAHAEADARTAERDLKAAAWDALQEAQATEGRLRTASSRVVGDAAHIASKLTHDAKTLAEEGKDRLGHLRHRDGTEVSAQEEIARLREELAQLRERSSGGRGARRELSALTSKITRNSGLDPNSVAADALAAGLDHLERSLKSRAPELLAAKDRRQVSALLQKEIAPVLRDSLIQGATAALSSWEAARSATSDLPRPQAQTLKSVVSEAPKQVARVLHRSAQANVPASSIAASIAAEMEAEEAAEATTKRVRQIRDESETATASSTDAASEVNEVENNQQVDEHHSKAGWLWGGSRLGTCYLRAC
jgi:hypothetical protein